MRLICESCDHGYAPEAEHCPWCGAPSMVAYMSHAESHFDIECYTNFFLVKFSTGESFEQHTGTTLDVKALTHTLSRYTLYSFNGRAYDVPMLALALDGAGCLELKQLSDSIIQDGVKYWDLPGVPWLDHIDMIEVCPGAGSQKSYGARMHVPVLQDLPYPPESILTWAQKCNIRTYCEYDIDTLKKLCETLEPAIRLRNHITKTEGLDVRSKSGPQIAEALFKKKLGRTVEKPFYPVGMQFYFRPAPWMKHSVLEVLARCPFTITETMKVEMAKELKNLVVTIGNTNYQMGMGGLHSKEESISHHEDAEYSLGEFDVAAYYPTTIVNTGVCPGQLGSAFKTIYRQWRDDRAIAKKKMQEIAKKIKELETNEHRDI